MSHLVAAVLTILVSTVSDAFAGGPNTVPFSVPEPSTLAVLAAGAGILAILKFRKRK